MAPMNKNALRKAKRKKAKVVQNVKVEDTDLSIPAFLDAAVPQSVIIADGFEVEIKEEDDEELHHQLTESILGMIVGSDAAATMTDDEIEATTKRIIEEYCNIKEASNKLHEYQNEFDEEDGEDLDLEVGEELDENIDFLNTSTSKDATVLINEQGERLSRKQRKDLMRPAISMLKGVAVHPDVVESWDASGKEPGLLIALKSWPNTVNVPTHWNSKRRYLAGKRAIDRGQFKLPPHIADTKIAEIRSALLQKEEDQSLRQKMRARARPKAHRMDIDYQTLHDAFFKYAVKPVMSGYGALYYEGKEQEMRFAKYLPGKLSEGLRDALGVQTPVTPVPWLFNLQRYGPPPSYPGLRVPGVNCPIPIGADFGYGVGGWGAPPVDSAGNALWGDLGAAAEDATWDSGNWTTYLWGDMDSTGRRADDDEEMEEASDEEVADDHVQSIAEPSAVDHEVADGMDTPASMISGITSTPSVGLSSGLETPGSVDLRKGIESAQGGSLGVTPYKVLHQKEVVAGSQQQSQFFQSSTLYDVQGALDTANEQASKIQSAPTAPPPVEPPRKKRKGFKF